MKLLTRVFWKTLWEDKKTLIIVIGGVLALVILGGSYLYTTSQIKRTWNWNIGGYKSRAHEMVCEMAETGVLEKGPNFNKECK